MYIDIKKSCTKTPSFYMSYIHCYLFPEYTDILPIDDLSGGYGTS